MTEPGHVHEQDEARAIAERYARREVGDRYHPLRPEIWQSRHDRERALIRLLRRHVQVPVAALDVLEGGCGHGDNLLELLRLGFDPARLVGNELLPERVAAARQRLPAATRLLEGDATQLALPDGSFDLVGRGWDKTQTKNAGRTRQALEIDQLTIIAVEGQQRALFALC